MDSTKGYIHVYTGNGKGKTTAAFGLAVRALCAGKSVYIGQFVKSMRYNETKIGQLFDQVKIEQLGRGCFIGKDPEAIDIRMARDGLTRCAALLESGEYDVVILDELTIALHFGLLTIDAVLDALNRRHPAVEVVVTGRYAPQELIDAADLVTEMREITLLHAGRPFPRRDRPLTGQKRSSSPDCTRARITAKRTPLKKTGPRSNAISRSCFFRSFRRFR